MNCQLEDCRRWTIALRTLCAPHRLLICGVSLLGFEVGLAPAAGAHPLAPALLELRENEPGRASVSWRTPAVLPRAMDESFGPVFPPSCQATEPARSVREGSGVTTRWPITCDRTLVGLNIEVRGIAASGSSALLRVELADGRRFQKLLTANAPVFRVPTRSNPSSVFRDYSALGWQHILSGADHLLFVFALMLCVRGWRQLLLTLTAFTLGHSLTLSLAVLGWIHVPRAPIEALIALSIAALAVELVVTNSRGRGERGLPGPVGGGARAPLLAVAFGLLHGLGFAGALAEIGVPQEEIPISLIAFNLGIELGQLAFMAAILGLAAAIRRLPARPAAALRLLRPLPGYAIGSLAAFWFYQRIAAAL